jgi:DNA-binding transcriptional LysR family regulator
MTALPSLLSLAVHRDLPKRRKAGRAGVLSPDDMLIFAAIVREGGVRKGALALDVPPSTVSRQLADLEQVLGGKLITRSTRRFQLTELGRSLLEQCDRLEQVMQATAEVAARSAKEPTGTLKVAASPMVGEELLPPVIAEYLRLYPSMSLEVSLSIEFVDLRRSGVDLALRTGDLQTAGDLYAVRLANSQKGLYASRSYLKARGTPRSLAELREHDCIMIGGRGEASWSFRSGAARVHVPVSGSLRVDSSRLARSAAINGVGIARLPQLLARPELEAGHLVPVLQGDWPKTTLYAVHASGSPAPPKIRAFIELLKLEMKNLC